MRVILMGSQGAGKGTQAAKLEEETGATHIETGDLVRSEIKQETELGQKIKEYSDKGELVPDEIIVEMMKPYLDEADLSQTNLSGANLGVANLRWADLLCQPERADLVTANMMDANLETASVTGANVTKAYLGSANLTARFTVADLLDGSRSARRSLWRLEPSLSTALVPSLLPESDASEPAHLVALP